MLPARQALQGTHACKAQCAPPASAHIHNNGRMPRRQRDTRSSAFAPFANGVTGAARGTTASPNQLLPERMDGYPQILLCSMLSGSHAPIMRLLYMEEHSLDPASITALRGVIAAAALCLALTATKHGNPASPALPVPAKTSDEAQPPLGSAAVLLAGSELGLYNFASAALDATGLQVLSATHATFLIQFAAVLTPLLSWLSGEYIAPQVWAAVALGVAGSCLVAYDSISMSLGSGLGDVGMWSGGEAQGVILVLGACLCNSLAVVRLGRHAPRFDSVELSAAKKVSMCVVSLAWVMGVQALQQPAADAAPALQAIADSGALATHAAVAGEAAGAATTTAAAAAGLFPWLPSVSPAGWLLLLYSALGPGALAAFLGAQGQRTVPAVQTQIILSLAPLWSALLAQAVLGGEEMGCMAWVGGGMVLLSVLAAQLGCSGPQAHRASQP